jgi:hypothetical protein
VPRTDHLIAVDRPARQDAAVVRADVFDREIVAVEVEYRHLSAVDVDDTVRSGWKFGSGRDADPVRHERPSDVRREA